MVKGLLHGAFIGRFVICISHISSEIVIYIAISQHRNYQIRVGDEHAVFITAYVIE